MKRATKTCNNIWDFYAFFYARRLASSWEGMFKPESNYDLGDIANRLETIENECKFYAR